MTERALVPALASALAAIARFPGYIVERWFGLYLAGWGLLCALEPHMFDSIPQAFDELRGTHGAYQEWHYALLFVTLGAFQFAAAKNRDRTALGRRAVAAAVAAAALFGLAAAFVIGGTVTSGTYTYGYLGVSEAAVLARLLMLRWGRKRGLVIESTHVVQARRLVSTAVRPGPDPLGGMP